MLQAAIDAGVRSFDTANIYAQGDSERILGKLQRANPAVALEIVTKAGFKHGRKTDIVRFAKPVLRHLTRFSGMNSAVKQVRASIDNQSFEYDFLSACVEDSQRRLGVRNLFGLILHDPDATVLTRHQTWQFLKDVKEQGRALQIGLSLRDEHALRAALAGETIDILQMPATAYEQACKWGLRDEILDKKIKIYIRQILNRDDGKIVRLKDILPALIADQAIHSVILGISQRRNLDAALEILG